MLSDSEKAQVEIMNEAVRTGKANSYAASAFINGSVTAIVQHLIEMTDASEVKYIVDLLTE